MVAIFVVSARDKSMSIDVSSADWYPGHAVWFVFLTYFLEMFSFA